MIPGFIPLELPSRQPPSPSAGDPKRWGSPLLPGGLLQASLSDPGCCAPRSSGFGDVMHFQRKLAEPRQSHFKSQATAASHVKPQQPPSHHLSALTLLWSVGRNQDEDSVFYETNLHSLQRNQMKTRKSLMGVGRGSGEASVVFASRRREAVVGGRGPAGRGEPALSLIPSSTFCGVVVQQDQPRWPCSLHGHGRTRHTRALFFRAGHCTSGTTNVKVSACDLWARRLFLA